MKIIDAKLIPALDRSIFDALRYHEVAAVSVVCSIWESFEQSLENFRAMQNFIAANSDILYQVFNIGDLDRDDAEQKTGVIFSWQNSEGFGGDLHNVKFFSELGLRIAQPTFISANAAGSGCQEPVDAGLTTYGAELVSSMNSNGIAVDLSHVGDRTAQDVLDVSQTPPFYAQMSPHALKATARNKTDNQIKAIADAGGVICLTTIRHHLPSGLDSTIDDLADTILHVRNVVGQDAVGLGSDLTPGQGSSFLDYVSREGGSGRQLLDYTHPPTLPGFEDFSGYRNLEQALSTRGLSDDGIERVMSTNLARYFGQVWHTTDTGELDHG